MSDIEEARNLLAILGSKIVDRYDAVVTELAVDLKDPTQLPEGNAARFLKLQGDDKCVMSARLSIEVILHDLFSMLQEAQEYRLQGRAKNGNWLTLSDSSDGLHGDLMKWLMERSRYGCASEQLAEFNLNSQRLTGNGLSGRRNK